MATPLDPKKIVPLEELALSSQGRVKYKGTSSQATGSRELNFLENPMVRITLFFITLYGVSLTCEQWYPCT